MHKSSGKYKKYQPEQAAKPGANYVDKIYSNMLKHQPNYDRFNKLKGNIETIGKRLKERENTGFMS